MQAAREAYRQFVFQSHPCDDRSAEKISFNDESSLSKDCRISVIFGFTNNRIMKGAKKEFQGELAVFD